MSKKCFEAFAWFMIGFLVGFVGAAILDDAFAIESSQESYLGLDYNGPCMVFQDYLDNPNDCSLHYLLNDPKYNGVIYLAKDGTVRWKVWPKKEQETK